MRVLLVLILFVVVGCSGTDTASDEAAVSGEVQASQDPAGDSIPAPEPVKIEGMANAVQVGDHLFGGQPTAEVLQALKDQGYKTVLTTRGDGELKWDEKALVESLGMRFVSIPMAYPIEAITDEQVGQFAELLEEGEGPMVLHCGSGNRVAGLWAVWLMEHRGVGREEALSLGVKAGMTRIRPVVEKRLGASTQK